MTNPAPQSKPSPLWLGLSLALSAAILVALCLLEPYHRGPDNPTWRAANAAYEHGRWQEAAEDYRSLLERGLSSASLDYNLGNSYARLGDVGRARLFYERGLRIAPRDRDLRANLRKLSGKMTDPEQPSNGFSRLVRHCSTNELAVAISLSWFTAVGLVALYIKRREGVLLTAALASLLGTGSLLAGLALQEVPIAIVLPAQVTLFRGPGRDFATLPSTVHAGTALRLLGSDGDWREVQAPDHLRGWARAEQLEAV